MNRKTSRDRQPRSGRVPVSRVDLATSPELDRVRRAAQMLGRAAIRAAADEVSDDV